MLKVKFWSDANLDSLVQIFALMQVEIVVDLSDSTIEVEDTDESRDLVSQWGGVIL